MIRFFMSMGPSGPIMVVISVVILVLTVSKTIQVLGRRTTDRLRLERGVDAILFWGAFSAVLGILGQFIGHYKGLNIMVRAETINPRMVFMGLAECISSTIMGLTILLLASLAWFTLRAVVRRQQIQSS